MAQLISELVEQGFFPTKTVDQDGKVMLMLVNANNDQFDTGFYLFDLYAQHNRESEIKLVDLDALEIDILPLHPPVGFIFHLGRSGSTAAVKMLNTLEQHQVIAEAPPLHSLLQSKLSASQDLLLERRKKLMAFFCLLGESRNCRTIFKMASWEVKYKAEFSKLYPQVNSCLIVRNPLEILVAILQKPPGWLQRANIRSTLALEKSQGIDDLQHYLRPIFGANIDPLKDQLYFQFVSSALQDLLQNVLNAKERYLVINHKDIIKRVPTDLCAHFNIKPDKKQRQTMLDSTGYNAKSKNKNERYVDDSDRKTAEATPELKRMCDRILQPLMRKVIEHSLTISSN